MPVYGLFRASSMNPSQNIDDVEKGKSIIYCTFSYYDTDNPNDKSLNNLRIYMKISNDHKTCEYSLTDSNKPEDWCKSYDELCGKIQTKIGNQKELVMIDVSKIDGATKQEAKGGSISIHEAALDYYTPLEDQFAKREISLGNVAQMMNQKNAFVGDFGLKKRENLPVAQRQSNLQTRMMDKAYETLVAFSKIPENTNVQKPKL